METSFVSYINMLIAGMTSGIVLYPQDVNIFSQSMATNTIESIIDCNEADRARIIGKDGMTIRAIRTIVHASVARNGICTYISVNG